ncbi:30S ribosomal protein S12 methylthiotransferase RimO [Thermodesulfobacteriota bacterium]
MKKEACVFLISLGCAKNLVDSEHMLGFVSSKGYSIAAELEEADIAIVNTCGFKRDAVEEAIETILEIASHKKKEKLRSVIVTGCLVQRYGYKLKKLIPEVDGWLGTGEIHRIADLLGNKNKSKAAPFFIGKPTYLPDSNTPRIQTTPFYSSYLRIAEGCSHRCSFCIIPRLRGPFRSRSMESLVDEAEKMVEEGVREFNLIGQDTTMYGKDLKKAVSLEDLLERLVSIRGIKWIRILYCHPSGITDRLLELIESEKTICPYLDIPFQHVNEKILKAMGRESDLNSSPYGVIERIRSCKRRISLRTTLMVGFQGETDEMFKDLYRFVETARFEHMGAFIFSAEKGSKAFRSRNMPDQKVAKERFERLMELQAGISAELNARLVGKTIPVLIEGVSEETDLLLKGRTSRMAPDTDGQVLISKGNGILGEIMDVRITQAQSFDIVGEIIS